MNECTLTIDERTATDNNCSGCHMPESPSIDIPHVTVTDHLIRIQPSEAEKKQDDRFSHLENVISTDTDPAMMALGYLSFYEKFTPHEALLDSAANYLFQKTKYPNKKTEAKVWLNFIQQLHDANRLIAQQKDTTNIIDAWTCFRLGTSLDKLELYQMALPFLQKSVDLQQFNLDFQNKYGAVLLKLDQFKVAKKVFEFIISENNQHISGLTNLGFVHLNMGNVEKATQ